MTWNTLLGILAIALGTFLLELFCCEVAFRRGKAKGYTEGRRAADQWWLGSERQVEETRQEIWREEG
jgi:hypothetical protein